MISLDKKLKQKARTLRTKGVTYDQISKNLHVGKSTARYWCNDIELSPELYNRIYNKNLEMLSKGPRSSHERRKKEIEKILDDAENEIKFPLEKDTYKLFGAALYWAEGNKVNDFTITNSD